MFETLSRLWREGRLTESALDKAITLSWITGEQKVLVMAQDKEVQGLD